MKLSFSGRAAALAAVLCTVAFAAAPEHAWAQG